MSIEAPIHFIPADSLVVGENRYRITFEDKDINALADSIGRVGLLHPPVVTQQEDGTCRIVAGERRFRALKTLHEQGLTFSYNNQNVPSPLIPCNLLDELNEIEAREIELEENIRRVNLSWKEESIAIANLHSLRQSQAPDAGWTLGDTAREISEKRGMTLTPTNIHDSLLIAGNMDKIKSATSKKEALKQVLQGMEADFSRELITRAVDKGEEFPVDFRVVDALEGMKTFEDESFDVILTDPPYGIDADQFNIVRSTVNRHNYSDAWRELQALFADIAKESFRVAKAKAHLYLFCDVLKFPELQQAFVVGGWDVWPRPMIWVKNKGSIPRANYGPQRRYECILYALKGDKPVNHLDSDVITIPLDEKRLHAAQKPVDLYVNLLKRSVLPGATVLDPFCGSGTIFLAAEKLHCKATGLDSDPACGQMIKERVQ